MENVDALTYNDIYEILRTEKNSADLEELTPETLEKISEYISSKHKLLEQQKSGTFSGAKIRSKILSEIDNAQQVLRDLFERRQRKIINIAIFTVRTDSKLKDTTNMLKNEVELYNKLLKHLKKSMNSFLTIISGELANTNNNSELMGKKQKEKTLKDGEKQVIHIEFLDSVPELTDADLNKHGPFTAGDTSSLPIELASLLLTQGKAKKI